MYKRHNEKMIQREILKYLATVEECWVIKVVISNERGCPDVLACIQGKFLALEIKDETGQPTAIQCAQHRRIEKAGGKVYIVRSVKEVQHIVKGMA